MLKSKKTIKERSMALISNFAKNLLKCPGSKLKNVK